jgi:apolipoprotein N-acyltransferase
MAKRRTKSSRAPRSARAAARAPGPGPSGQPRRPGELAAGTDRAATAFAVTVAAISGAMWFLACADFDIWPLAWIAMVPGLWLIERAPTRRRALTYGWIVGLVANVGGFYWIVGLLVRFANLPLPLAVLGLLLLAAYQALVFLLFALVVRRLREVSADRLGAPLPMALLAPLVMVTFELLVPFIFPWYLAITQAWVTPVIQIAELTGPLGVTALLLAINGAIYDVLTEKRRRRRLLPAAAAAATLVAALGFGMIRMAQIDARRAEAPKIKVGVVQGNIGFDEKGVETPKLRAQQLADLQRMSGELERAGAQLIMWSESAFPYRISRDATHDQSPQSPARIRRGFDAPLLLGAITYQPDDPDGYPYNSALMLDSDGRFTGRFDKIFLLMFGEYIPGLETFPSLRKVLPRAAGHFARGEEIVTFPIELDGVTYRIGPMICYEDILPSFNRKLARHRPHLLANITNDAWFGDTSEPWQHLALSVYRSVEIRTEMVRAVNTGVSAFIDANGRVISETYAVDPKKDPRGVDGLLDEAALMEGGHTFYARFGDVFGRLCALVTLGAWLVWPRLRRRRRDEQA